MSRFNLHLELLEKQGVRLAPGGSVFIQKSCDNYIGIQPYPKVRINLNVGTHEVHTFSGPTWVYIRNWEFYNNGITIGGENNLLATVVQIENDKVHVTELHAGTSS